MNGLMRPVGPVRIKGSAVKAPDVLVARLGGAVRAEVAVVKNDDDFYFVAPKRLGGIQKIPADSLTDCLNYSVWELNDKVRKRSKK